VSMYTESARRVCGLEKATLTRCEGEEEGVGTAVESKIGPYSSISVDGLTCEL
jgi:hypothetical protein